MRRFPYVRVAIYIYAGVIATAAMTSKQTSAQGFGAVKETVTLDTILPAVAHLPAKDLKLVVNPAAAGSAEFGKSLAPEIQSMLQNGSGLFVEIDPKTAANARILVECTITQFTSYNSKVVQQSPDRKIKGKTIPGEKDQIVTAQLTIAYRAVDVKTRHPIDAEVIDEKYDETFTQGKKKKSLVDQGKGFLGNLKKQVVGGGNESEGDEELVPTAQQVYTKLDENIAGKIASHLVETNKKIQIKLAKGDLLGKEAKVAVSDNWELLHKDLVSMGELPKAENESYRQYDLGVADEAMGYKASSNPKDALPYFESAVKEYKAAINGNRDEKYFLETQSRIEIALDNTQKRIDRMENGGKVLQSDLKETAAAGDSKDASETTQAKAPAKAASADDDLITDASIIELAKGGVDTANIIETIRDAKKFDFKLTANALLELKNANVANEVITAMRQKNREAKGPATTRGAAPRPAAHS